MIRCVVMWSLVGYEEGMWVGVVGGGEETERCED